MQIRFVLGIFLLIHFHYFLINPLKIFLRQTLGEGNLKKFFLHSKPVNSDKGLFLIDNISF